MTSSSCRTSGLSSPESMVVAAAAGSFIVRNLGRLAGKTVLVCVRPGVGAKPLNSPTE